MKNPLSLKNLCTANVSACLSLKTAEKVFVLNLKCAFSLKNSKLCFLGCNGYSSGSAPPNISISFAKISTACPLPFDATKTPLTLIQELVVICFNSSSVKSSPSATT